ncbi:MAG: gamma-glutamyltransferase [Actinobacteria bacterium]|nr:MAG: gamma-glutamyltransferase [Actinomycetota bacterium]
MSARGAVAAGHPLTAEAGARVLREGGNAVDAAVAAVLTSFVAESPLTGLGAGGFMLIHDPTGEDVLLDFFVEVPGRTVGERRSELLPIPVYFSPEQPQVFNVGAASCGVPGTAAGLARALDGFGSVPLAELVREPARLAREGVEVNAQQAFIFKILDPILTNQPEGAAIYAPAGRILLEGERFVFGELADALERYGAEGSEPFYTGEVARRVSEWVVERGGTLGADDLAAYEPQIRDPVGARYAGRYVLTNPPPSSGGVLIAFALALLDAAGSSNLATVVAAMEEAQVARTEAFFHGLYEEGFARQFLTQERLDGAADRVRAGTRPPEAGHSGSGDRLGSTTHITAVDGNGRCASVTCSNGTGSGVIVPGTGIHVNNMLGEEDLNPLGFHMTPAGRRVTSMMSPTVVLRNGQLEMGLGSGGSNRIRSAVLQTIIRVIADGMDAQEAVTAPRVHYEAGAVQAEPGVDERGLDTLAARGFQLVHWHERNLFFGGVHGVARDPVTGRLTGGGDPRRGGAVAYA